MIETDILVIGAGPAGLATALKLKRGGFSGRVVVLDKAKAAGNHVLSGAVIDPAGFKELLSEAEIAALPCECGVRKESFRFVFGEGASVKIPWVPPMMRSHGYPIGSLAKVVKYLAQLAEADGVEIYHGFAASGLLKENGRIVGARTGEKGVDAQGERKGNYLASEEIRAKLVVLAEGAAGYNTQRLIKEERLQGGRPQVYALGIREVIELAEPVPGSAGEIMHTFGYPVDMLTYGGGFVYRPNDRQVMVGFAVGLDYRDAALQPHELFRRFKATKTVQAHIKGGKPVAYGAKLIPEGGFYALPRPYAAGALIVGDGAGLVDGLRIKGVHLALESGVAAAEAILGGLDGVGERYWQLLKATPGYSEVRRVKNVHGGFSYCAPIGVMMAGFAWATFGRLPWWPVGRVHRDCETLREIRKAAETGKKLKAEGPDRLTDVFLSGTVHDEDQPCHLKIGDMAKCDECARQFGSPCTRFCPAEVYRREADGSLRIDFSNCLHCKTCEVKCPFGNLTWTPPQGGDGPRYT